MTFENGFLEKVIGAVDVAKNFDREEDASPMSNLLTFTFERPASEIPSENSFTSSCFDPHAVKRASDFLQRYQNLTQPIEEFGPGKSEQGLARFTIQSKFRQQTLVGTDNYYRTRRMRL